MRGLGNSMGVGGGGSEGKTRQMWAEEEKESW